MENYVNNNRVEIWGTIADDAEFSHEIYGEKFFIFTMDIPRLSGIYDKIKIMVSERLTSDVPLCVGDRVKIIGQFRSYNSSENGTNRLILTVFTRDILKDGFDEENPNSIYLNGYICKQPVYRTTPFGREITDMLLAVNRTYNKSDYIPVIAWGRNARFCKNLNVGDNVRIRGRIQSREYQKKLDDDEIITKTAYEVSVSKLEVAEDISD